ncbi:MAG: hypothetical protein IJ353_00530 [Lachnospiraceae bacterium]|nr:hypothetical protein [Lachnospiraceae bacterium]
MKDKKIAIYHRVYRRENFEKAAKDLFDPDDVLEEKMDELEEHLIVLGEKYLEYNLLEYFD